MDAASSSFSVRVTRPFIKTLRARPRTCTASVLHCALRLFTRRTRMTEKTSGEPAVAHPPVVADAIATLDGLARREALFETLMDAIRARRARVAVMGLGYVGLPLVRLFASKGFSVIA